MDHSIVAVSSPTSRRRSLRTGALAVLLILISLHSGPRAHVLAQAATEVHVLDNGLTVIIEPRPDALTTGLSLVVRAGSRDDPTDRPGLAWLVARAMVGGTEAHPSPRALTEQIKLIGGKIGIGVDSDLTHYVARVPVGSTDAALDFLGDTMSNPRFSIQDLSDSLWDALSGYYAPLPGELAAALWPEHPAGRTMDELTDEEFERTVYSFTYPDLIPFKDTYFVAGNMVLTVVGVVDPTDVLAHVEQRFSTIPAGERRPIDVIQPGAPKSGEAFHRSYGDQPGIVLAFPTPGFLSPDYPAERLIAVALDGAPGLLFQDLRAQHGLLYSVGADAYDFADVGALIAYADVDQDKLGDALDRMQAVFQGLRQNPPHGDQLTRLRARLEGQEEVYRESTTYAADVDATNAIFGLPIDPAAWSAMYAAVTDDDMRRIAATYFASNRAILHVFAESRPAPPEPDLATLPVGTEWTIAATDYQFSSTNIGVPAGVPITLTLRNDGPSPHTWHLLKAKGTVSREYKTAQVQPGESAAITFQIDQPGNYYFQCDVHPVEMLGLVTVVPSTPEPPATEIPIVAPMGRFSWAERPDGWPWRWWPENAAP